MNESCLKEGGRQNNFWLIIFSLGGRTVSIRMNYVICIGMIFQKRNHFVLLFHMKINIIAPSHSGPHRPCPAVPSIFIFISFTPLSSYDHMIKPLLSYLFEFRRFSNFKLVSNILRSLLLPAFLSSKTAAQRYQKHLYLCTTTPFPGLLRRISQLALVFVQLVFYTRRRKYVEVY